MWVSKLCTADGKRIRGQISKHQKNEEEYVPTLTKPYQPKPNTASWKILDRVIQNTTTSNEFTIRDEYSLGTWTEHHSNLGNWQAYTDLTRTTIWLRTSNSTWYRCKHFGTQPRLKEEDNAFEPSSNHIPIQISKYSNNQIHYSQPQQRAKT